MRNIFGEKLLHIAIFFSYYTSTTQQHVSKTSHNFRMTRLPICEISWMSPLCRQLLENLIKG